MIHIYKYLIPFIKNMIDLFGLIYSTLFGHALFRTSLGKVLNSLSAEELTFLTNEKFLLSNVIQSLHDFQIIKTQIALTGEFMFHYMMVHLIKTRLKFENYLKENSHLNDVEIKKPVFIVTLPRSGSTFLHCLMAQDDKFFVPEYWMQARLFPSPSNPFSNDDKNSIESFSKINTVVQCLMGWDNFHAVHSVGIRDPEDINNYTMYSGVNYFACGLHGMDELNEAYMKLSEQQFVNPIGLLWKRALQCCIFNYNSKRLLTINHIGLGNIESLVEIFPDAKFIAVHRNPIKAFSSMNSLAKIMQNYIYGFWQDLSKIKIRPLTYMVGYGLENRYIPSRQRIIEADGNSDRFIDVLFKDLVENPVNCLKYIYEKLDQEWTTEGEEKMIKYIKLQKEHKIGRHKYEVAKTIIDTFTELGQKYSNIFHITDNL